MSSLKKLFSLDGKIALITGGSRGLGFQIAEALGEFGATVILVARKQHELDRAVQKLEMAGIRAGAIAADLGGSAAPEGWIEEVLERYGDIDILVNNAGTTWGAPAEVHPLGAWNKVMDLNVTSLFLLCQAVAKRCFLPAGKGAIINLASIEGLGGHHPEMTGTIAYNTAKGAVVNFTKALAAEWGPKNIRVNSIAPGYFPSKMTNGTIAEHGERMLEEIPLGKFGGADDLKGTALLLASEAGGHITGQTLIVDGGATVI